MEAWCRSEMEHIPYWRDRYSSYQVVRWDDKRVERCEVCTSVAEEFNCGLSFGGTGPKRDSWRRRFQDIQWLIDSSEGHSTQQLIQLEK